ncbi:tyrosine-type recombinase/integrase [Clostridium sp. HBUAS56010]|uniref:tyrosine-type recombinase/integrase n=1 Tax=Clostridium sp. HBUAS56010 TaxID=2571127 RepID=UPI00117837A6|nr:tyrosine-type recombinase/integrase [Clostridium sp. HBUAS56010]
MNKLNPLILNYLVFCKNQKRLDSKTIKAYKIDLTQFAVSQSNNSFVSIKPDSIEEYITSLHQSFKPRTVRRKIATLKAFFHYLEYKNIIEINPFNKLRIQFRSPVTLPKIIPLHTIEDFLSTLYKQKEYTSTTLQRKYILRDIAVIELLFATGIRISELCSLRVTNIDFIENNILIYGKGSKERRIQIGNQDVIIALKDYYKNFKEEIDNSEYFFINRIHNRLSEQSVRNMINKYAHLASIRLHITPHMFRHSFATYLLEEDVDIRYIQEILGHSSINVTEIYTHVTMAKQKNILTQKHPRNTLKFI